MCVIPVIAFDSGFNTDWHTLKKDFGQVLLLAGPGIVVIAILVALIFKYPLGYSELSWSEVLLIGSILSATDPVAVIAMLKEVGASKKISVIIDGESLLNDGTAMVFFHVMSTVVKEGSFNVGDIVGLFFRLTLGAWTLGFMFAVVVYYWFKRLTNDAVEAAALTFFSAYLLFLLPEGTEVEMSGILAICSMGYFLSGFSGSVISPLVEAPLHHVWNFASWVAETELFMLVGVIIGGSVLRDGVITGKDWGMLPVHFVLLYLTRVVMLGLFYPILKYSGYSINWRNFIIFVHAGLRGGVGLALSLTVFIDTDYTTPLRNICIFQVAGMAVMTVVINGCTGKMILMGLGLADNSGEQEVVINDAVKSVLHAGNHLSSKLMTNENLGQADWTRVQTLTGSEAMGEEVIARLTRGQHVIKSMKKERRAGDTMMNEYEDALSSVQVDKRLAEARRRLLLVIKTRYDHYRQRALCLPNTFVYLQHEMDIANDFAEEKLCTWDVIEKSLFKSVWFRVFFWFRKVPGVRRLVRRFVYNKIGMTYDCCLAFLSAHAEAWVIFEKNFPGLLSQISEELKSEKDAQIVGCKEFMRKHLLVSYQHIVQIFQERTASILVLNKFSDSVASCCEKGVLTGEEGALISQSVDDRLWSMFYVNPLKGVPSFKESVSQWPMWKDFPTELIKLINDLSVPELLDKDELLYAQMSEVKTVYIVVHGRIIEKNEKEVLYDHEPGSIVGGQYALLPSNVAETEARTDILVYVRRIGMSAFRGCLSANEKDLWRIVCPTLIAFSENTDQPLCSLNSRQLIRLLSTSKTITPTVHYFNYLHEGYTHVPHIPDVEQIEADRLPLRGQMSVGEIRLHVAEGDRPLRTVSSAASIAMLPDLYERWLKSQRNMSKVISDYTGAGTQEELPKTLQTAGRMSDSDDEFIPPDP